MARASSVTLPVGSAPSNMVEVCSPCLWAMLTTSAPGAQWVYIAIKQLVALCSQNPFKCSVARPPKKARTFHATSMNQEAIFSKSCTSTCGQQTEPIGKVWASFSFGSYMVSVWLCLFFLWTQFTFLCLALFYPVIGQRS